jgi:hypothetical protein
MNVTPRRSRWGHRLHESDARLPFQPAMRPTRAPAVVIALLLSALSRRVRCCWRGAEAGRAASPPFHAGLRTTGSPAIRSACINSWVIG